MAGIDDFTPTEYAGGGSNAETKGGSSNAETKAEAHDLVASGEITLSFGWDYDPTSS